MIRSLKLTTFLLVGALIGIGLVSAQSFAASQEPVYRFEIVDQTIHAGRDVTISVRLIKTHNQAPDDNKMVRDAVIAAPKLQMLMDGMAPMPAQVRVLPQDTNGNYHFACDMTVPGNWELDLSAQVPEETDTVHNTLKFHVVK